MGEKLEQFKQRVHDRKHPPVPVAVFKATWAWTCPHCVAVHWTDERIMSTELICQRCDKVSIGYPFPK
ncbi:hypothetical protein LCGC14_0992280 [marine sediment metagenome]|uniref:Uncharacterized protein n=1 Tax=marine sediment metagenome TaxID=412755 RepID=A0A0F9NA33_9ZZZZ